jgi:hypothetical protein
MAPSYLGVGASGKPGWFTVDVAVAVTQEDIELERLANVRHG